jgi:hypothetical protein
MKDYIDLKVEQLNIESGIPTIIPSVLNFDAQDEVILMLIEIAGHEPYDQMSEEGAYVYFHDYYHDDSEFHEVAETVRRWVLDYA